MLCFTHGKSAREQLIPMKTLPLHYRQQYMPLGCFQLFVSTFYTCTQCSLFPCDCSSQSFSLLLSILGSCACFLRIARILWAIFKFPDSQKYCSIYSVTKASPKRTTDFHGIATVTDKYTSEQKHFFLFSFPFLYRKNLEWCKNSMGGVS